MNLKPASYKSPSGQVISFSYEDLEMTVDSKAAVFETATGNGTYVQPNGHTGGRFAMSCYIHGQNYEANAEAFLAALLEDGEGVLTHPILNEIHVVPVGTISRMDNLKTAANQVVFGVTFYETTGLQIGEHGGLPQVFDDLTEASALDFSEKVQTDDPFDKESFKIRVTAMTKNTSSAMKQASGAVAEINEAIDDRRDSINRGLDVVIGEPLTLAKQVQLLIGGPRLQNSSANAKLLAYHGLATSIFSGKIAEPSKYGYEAANEFHLNRLAAQAIIGNMALLAVDTDEFKTRSEYVYAATRLADVLEEYQTWHDGNFASLNTEDFTEEHTDTGDGTAELVGLVRGACGDMIHQSFGAKTEMRETLTADTALHPLCYRLIGTAKDPALDEFIALNGLVLDELLMVPKGREIVYHV